MKMFCFVDTKLNTFDYLEERIGPYRRLQKIVTNFRSRKVWEGVARMPTWQPGLWRDIYSWLK